MLRQLNLWNSSAIVVVLGVLREFSSTLPPRTTVISSQAYVTGFAAVSMSSPLTSSPQCSSLSPLISSLARSSPIVSSPLLSHRILSYNILLHHRTSSPILSYPIISLITCHAIATTHTTTTHIRIAYHSMSGRPCCINFYIVMYGPLILLTGPLTLTPW